MNAKPPAGWTRKTVRDVIERHYCGPSPTCEERTILNAKEWGLLKTTAITWEAGWDWTQHKVPPQDYWQQPALEVHPGDVLVTKAGPRHRVGVVCHVSQTPPRLMVSGKMIGLRPSASVVPRILAGVLSTIGPQKFLDQRTTGMAESQVNFANQTLLGTPIDIPPYGEQARIAAILDIIDEAIRRTEQVIAKLQQMNHGLLYELLTRGIDENGELRNPARHPDQFKDSILGKVPLDWEVGQLSGWLAESPKNGYSPKAVDEWTGTMMLGLGCLTQDGFRAKQLKNAPRNDPQLVRALLKHGDLLLNRSNTRELVGLIGRYEEVGAPCVYPDLMMRLTLKNSVNPCIMEQVLRAPWVRRQIQSMAAGTSGSMVKISTTIVKRLWIAIPTLIEQEAIRLAYMKAANRVEREKDMLAKLRCIKSGLMDDLLTGRVRVAVPEETA